MKRNATTNAAKRNEPMDGRDEFGGRFVRVRGGVKVTGHLMFGVLVLSVGQLMRLVT